MLCVVVLNVVMLSVVAPVKAQSEAFGAIFQLKLVLVFQYNSGACTIKLFKEWGCSPLEVTPVRGSPQPCLQTLD
jgi:hypothetical protein